MVVVGGWMGHLRICLNLMKLFLLFKYNDYLMMILNDLIYLIMKFCISPLLKYVVSIEHI